MTFLVGKQNFKVKQNSAGQHNPRRGNNCKSQLWVTLLYLKLYKGVLLTNEVYVWFVNFYYITFTLKKNNKTNLNNFDEYYANTVNSKYYEYFHALKLVKIGILFLWYNEYFKIKKAICCAFKYKYFMCNANI